MPPQTPFLSVIFVSFYPLHDFYIDVEVGWHVIALYNNLEKHIFKIKSEFERYGKQKSCQKYQLNILYDIPNGYLQSIIAANQFFTKFYEFHFTLGKNLHTFGL